MVNDIRSLGIMVGKLPVVDISPDPYDNFLLTMAEAARADLLVTGDKRGLLNLGSHRNTRIVTARVALDTLGG